MISIIARKLLDADNKVSDMQSEVNLAMKRHMQGINDLRLAIQNRDQAQYEFMAVVNDAIKEGRI